MSARRAFIATSAQGFRPRVERIVADSASAAMVRQVNGWDDGQT